ncbi:MAG: glycosyltransferase [Elioraea sp.]|nr:glycosyltransferase [Elioraea sp.]
MATPLDVLNRPLRVLHVITTLGPGGAEAMLAKLVAATRDVAHHVVSLDDRTHTLPALRAAGAQVSVLGARSPLLFPFHLPRLVSVAAAARADVVQSWLWHADLAATIARATLRPPPPLVWSIRCSNMDLGQYAGSTRLVLAALARLSRLPDVVLANSEAGLAWHRARGFRPRRTLVIPNGFDLDLFRPDPAARPRLLALLGWPQETVLVGLIARVDPMKDHATFLSALARTALPVRAVLIGWGTEALPLPSELAPRVAAFGQRSDVAALLPGFDILCLSSRFGEGFPNVLGEAMACGVPCVTTDVGDAAQVVGEAGLVVPPGDAAALAGAITALAADPHRRQAMGRAGRELAARRFSIQAVADAYRRLWRDLATGRTVPP